jgi:hypothetical protein
MYVELGIEFMSLFLNQAIHFMYLQKEKFCIEIYKYFCVETNE